MYPIGIFSKMNRVTTKTLRYYDEIELLKPAYIDDFTGYRYYGSEQFTRLSQILTLKQMGLSLSDIKDIIDDQKGIEIYLNVRENELKKSITEAHEKLLSVQNYRKRLKGESMMTYHPVLRSLPEVIVASMRFNAKNYDEYFDRIPKMGIEMGRLGAVCSDPPYCFNIYHDGEYKDKNIDVEVCEAVVDYCKESEMVKFKKIGGVDMALCILHKGPYHLLREAYVFAFEWIKDNHFEVIGLPRESFIDGIWNKSTDLEWLTELQIPIAKTN